MTDFRFNEIVESNIVSKNNKKYAKSICKSCSKQYKVDRDEFKSDNLLNLDNSRFIPESVDENLLEYVAEMRAWNCCHEDEQPIDDLPDIDSPKLIEFEK